MEHFQCKQYTPALHRCSWSLVVAGQCSVLKWLLAGLLRQALLVLQSL